MTYRKWFERKPELLEQEINRFAEENLSFTLNHHSLSTDQIVTFQGTVDILGDPTHLELVYPSEFPHFPILVFSESTNLPRHQHPHMKNLCVIPHNNEGWETWMTGAYMVKQAIRLLTDSKIGKDAVAQNEVDAPEPWSNYIVFKGSPLFIPEEINPTIPQYGTFQIGVHQGKYTYTPDKYTADFDNFYVLETLYTEDKTVVQSFPKTLPFQENKRGEATGFWFKLSSPPIRNLYNIEDVITELEQQLGKDNNNLLTLKRQVTQYKKTKPKLRKDMPRPHLAILFPEETYERNNFRLTFIWGIYYFDFDEVIWHSPQFATIEEHFQRIPKFYPLKDSSIMVVGLGSIGSAVALELGKCGVGNLVLADYDQLELGNLSRHTGNLPFVGSPKTRLVSDQIRYHNPLCKVEPFDVVLGRVNPKTKSDGSFYPVYLRFQDVDLVIDTTADESVSRILNRFAVEMGRPIIHSWVTNGAIGGRIIRYVPLQSGCYYCFANSSPIEVASSPIGEIFPGGCGFPTFAGASHDIYEVATHTVRMATNLLLNNKERYDHLIIEHYPPKVEFFPIEIMGNCPICGEHKQC